MPLARETKQQVISGYAIVENDTGSPEVQIALLTERIRGAIVSGIFRVRFWLFLLGALAAGIFWIGIYVGISYFLGEEIAKVVGKIGTKALIGVIVLVAVGLAIRAGLTKWRATRQARAAEQDPPKVGATSE